MDPALAGLAGAAGAAVVEAMATDFWSTARARLARIVGRAGRTAEEQLDRELDESAQRLSRPHSQGGAAAAEQERWTALLAVFLAEHREFSAELQDFVGEVRRSLGDAGSAPVVQNVTAGRNAFIAGRDQHITRPADDDDR